MVACNTDLVFFVQLLSIIDSIQGDLQDFDTAADPAVVEGLVLEGIAAGLVGLVDTAAGLAGLVDLAVAAGLADTVDWEDIEVYLAAWEAVPDPVVQALYPIDFALGEVVEIVNQCEDTGESSQVVVRIPDVGLDNPLGLVDNVLEEDNCWADSPVDHHTREVEVLVALGLRAVELQTEKEHTPDCHLGYYLRCVQRWTP